MLNLADRIRPANDGFNNEWAVVESLRDGSRNVIGYTLETKCGISKKYLFQFFDDPHAVAILALNSHQCPTPKETKDK